MKLARLAALALAVWALPTAAGSQTFSFTVAAGKLSAQRPAVVGRPYGTELQTRGGKAPFHYKVVSGQLPTGLHLNYHTGAITGTPTAPGLYGSIIRATDTERPASTASQHVEIKVQR